MKEKFKIYIILVLIVGGLIGGFLIWRGYQKTERQYRACLEKCEVIKPSVWDFPQKPAIEYDKYNICKAECKEKYAK